MAFRELKAIDVMSMATVSAVIAAIWGFVAGVLMALGMGMASSFGAMAGMEAVPMYGFGAAAIVIFPIIYAIVGFVAGAITAFIYNIVAQKVGGVKLDL
jgi:hypothetical protein